MGMSNQEPNVPTLDNNLQEIHDLKVAALGMLLESHEIKRETQMQLKDIFDSAHIDKYYLLRQLADYLSKRNPKLFEADNLMKQGHEMGKSVSIANLNLSAEDSALLEWYQQVRL
jgi:hypothetical protein